jgi:site-specific DNA-methyltransferase (adenine-specific)
MSNRADRARKASPKKKAKAPKRLYTLACLDALEWLKKRRATSIRAVVTDPPFGLVEYLPEELKKRENGKGIWRLPRSYDGYTRIGTPRFTILTPTQLNGISTFHRKLSRALYRVLVPGGHVIMASHGLLSHLVIRAFLNAGFELRGQIARVVTTLRGGDRPKGAHKIFRDVSVTPRACWEPWLIFRKPFDGLVRDNLTKWQTGALRRPSTETPFKDLIVAGPVRGAERKLAPHPSVKPQKLLRQLVKAALPMRAGIVLDPFMGSGSTLAAAQALRVRSIGIEINREYFDLAKKAIPKLAALKVPAADLSANGTARAKVRRPRAAAKLRRQKKPTGRKR